MGKYILYGHSGSGNHGCEAIVRTTSNLCGEKCTVFSDHPEQDKKYGVDNELFVRKMNVDIPIHSFRRYFFAIYDRIFKNSMFRYQYCYGPFLKQIEKGKIYLSVGGDHYCYGKRSNYIYGYLNKAIKSKGGKTVLWSCSIEGKDIDAKTALDLKSYDLITVRESLSYNALFKSGIRDNVVLCPDVAFILEPNYIELPNGFEINNTVGINLSPMVMGYSSDATMLLDNYRELIQYIIRETHYQIALIPHVVWADTDDREPLEKLYEEFKDSKRVILIKDHAAAELKGYIARCRFFIGARTHSTIAAYSSKVPTLVVGYSIKAKGIATDLFGTYDQYVLSAQNLKRVDELCKAFIWIQANEVSIRTRLDEVVPNYQERVKKCVDYLRML